jgi:hypothetical protein
MAVALIVISLLSGMAALVWQTRITLDARQGAAPGSLWFTPFWLMSSGFGLAGCCAAVYFLRPSRMRVAGALMGGTLYALCFTGQYRIGFLLGWWHSRLPESPDPLKLLSLPVFMLLAIVGTVLMLILLAVGRRFGWKVQSVLIVLVAFGQPLRERIWFTTILPVMRVDAGIVPYLAAAAAYIAGLSLGLLIAQRIGGSKQDRALVPSRGPETGTA